MRAGTRVEALAARWQCEACGATKDQSLAGYTFQRGGPGAQELKLDPSPAAAGAPCCCWQGHRVHEWRCGDVYKSEGPGTWVVLRVSKAPASLFGDDYTKTRTARGTVILFNDAMNWELIAPWDHADLQHLRRIGA